jgi:hypothetical protein
MLVYTIFSTDGLGGQEHFIPTARVGSLMVLKHMIITSNEVQYYGKHRSAKLGTISTYEKYCRNTYQGVFSI